MRLVYNSYMNNKNMELTQQLLRWYDEHARILPWRQDPSAYRVWVSEIMLQQTRVEAVKPFFERFMQALPTIQDLAQADQDTLHKLWEGLGYYNRVKNMKKAAMLCVEHHQGSLPSSYDELLKLPGIGPYSAGAIASIAYQQQVPAVDGNVLRVFSRITESYDDILKEKTKKNFQALLMSYLPKDRPDAFNQAVMEIGAMICVPNGAPKCKLCPCQEHCLAHLHNTTSELPVKTAKKKRMIEHRFVAVLVCDQEVYLQQREEGLLAGLYGFPSFLLPEEQDAFLKDEIILQSIKLKDAKHIFTHKEWHMEATLYIVKSKREGVWANREQVMHQYAIPTAFQVHKEAFLQWIQD